MEQWSTRREPKTGAKLEPCVRVALNSFSQNKHQECCLSTNQVSLDHPVPGSEEGNHRGLTGLQERVRTRGLVILGEIMHILLSSAEKYILNVYTGHKWSLLQHFGFSGCFTLARYNVSS